MGRRKINPNLKASPEVEELMSKFVPRFADENDIEIVNLREDLGHLLTLAESEDERRTAIKKITKTNKARQVEIKRRESRLIWLFEKRNELSPE